MRFTDANTPGYGPGQLEELNRRFDAAMATARAKDRLETLGCDLDQSYQDSVAATILATYDDEVEAARVTARRIFATARAARREPREEAGC